MLRTHLKTLALIVVLNTNILNIGSAQVSSYFKMKRLEYKVSSLYCDGFELDIDYDWFVSLSENRLIIQLKDAKQNLVNRFSFSPQSSNNQQDHEITLVCSDKFSNPKQPQVRCHSSTDKGSFSSGLLFSKNDRSSLTLRNSLLQMSSGFTLECSDGLTFSLVPLN